MNGTQEELERAVWAVAERRASADQVAIVEGDLIQSQRIVDRLIDQLERDLDAVRRLTGPEREQVITDFEGDLVGLRFVEARLGPAQPATSGNGDEPIGLVEHVGLVGEARLQASWSAGRVVVWAAGPGAAPEDNEQLAARLEAIGGPALGWSVHPDVVLPSGARADALSIPVRESLGWLIAVAGGHADAADAEGVGPSVTWLSRVATLAVRLVAQGAVVPALRRDRADTQRSAYSVRWGPAIVDVGELDELARAMPGPIVAITDADARPTTLAIVSAVVDAIVTDAASRVELPAPPPFVRTAGAVAEAVATRLDGSSFAAPAAPSDDVVRRLDGWARSVTRRTRPTLIVQLDPPDSGNAWSLAVSGPAADGHPVPIEQALGDSADPKPLLSELARLERLLPALRRPGQLRRGQVVLSQTEAWELMTITGLDLEAAGFTVRAPAISRRRPSPSLRLFTERTTESVVGAHQLSDVRWSVLFDDVELTAADIARLAADSRPLVKSRGRWVEHDAVDLKEAADALAERASTTRLSGAEILRYGIGLDGPALAGGVSVEGSSWATDLLHRASELPTEPQTSPDGFTGELRSYQAQARAWLQFLESAGLGGCLALDMGLGKTPTVLAQVAASPGEGATLVVAPAAVVGNWEAEAARFTPDLRVVVHHGADRATEAAFDAEVAGADIVITTYGTAVRDVDAIATHEWTRLILDEAQAVKNPASETAQQLRRITARTKVALTGTPIENGLGDLWAILDFTNPGLVGPRPTFLAQMAGGGEAVLRALNGILVFRRTKLEPVVAAELPDRIDELDHCTMTTEQIGLYQAVLDQLVARGAGEDGPGAGAILAAITALKQVCNHPVAYEDDGRPLAGRSGKLARLEEIVGSVFEAGERILVFTHFAQWGRRLAAHLSDITGVSIDCYDGSLTRRVRDQMVADFQGGDGPGALVLSLKAGGTGLNLTAASHVVLYDRWWNPAVEDQARDRAWRIGQTRTVISHRLVCPGTIDERVEEVVAGKRHIADLVLPKSSSLADLNSDQLRLALGIRPDSVLREGE